MSPALARPSAARCLAASLASLASLIGGLGAFAIAEAAQQTQSIAGVATYRERIALPPTAVFEATLEDVSRADATAPTIGITRIASPGNPPIAFAITYDPTRILPGRRYAVRARIVANGRPMFTSDSATPVTPGNGAKIAITLRMVESATNPPAPGGAQSRGTTPNAARGATTTTAPPAPRLEGTYWKAIEIAGQPVPPQDPKREAHVILEPGARVSAADGCNQLAGNYVLKGEFVTFGQMIATQMACPNTEDLERGFREALARTAQWRIESGRLQLLDTAGTRLAMFQPGG